MSGPCTSEVSELKAGGQVAFSGWVSEGLMGPSDSEVRSWVLPSTSPRCSASYCGPCPWRQEPAEASSVRQSARRKAESKTFTYFTFKLRNVVEVYVVIVGCITISGFWVTDSN